jgi:hypothetical protein
LSLGRFYAGMGGATVYVAVASESIDIDSVPFRGAVKTVLSVEPWPKLSLTNELTASATDLGWRLACTLPVWIRGRPGGRLQVTRRSW